MCHFYTAALFIIKQNLKQSKHLSSPIAKLLYILQQNTKEQNILLTYAITYEHGRTSNTLC